MTWPEFLDALKIYGPLGVWCAVATWGCYHLYRNGRTDAKEHAASLKTIAADFAGKLDERDKASHHQVTELTNRFVELYKEVATENQELTTQVRALIEVVSRKRGR